MKSKILHNFQYGIIYIILGFLSLNFMVSCGNSNKVEKVTIQKAMDYFTNNSPQKGALYYCDNRSLYPFLDTLYADSIYPAIIDLDYYNLKEVYYILKQTPLQFRLKPFVEAARRPLFNNIKKEIHEHEELEKNIFQNETLPLIKLGLDSMIHSDISLIMDEYTGAFGWKNIKHYFSNNEKEFQTLWNKYISVEKYQDYVMQAANNYLKIICNSKKQYIKAVTDRNLNQEYNINLSPIHFSMSDSTMRNVEKYTFREVYDMTIGLLKDWVAPAAIGSITGGVGTVIYEAAVLGYDVKVTYDEIKEEKLSSEDLLICYCEAEITRNIDKYIMEKYINEILNKIENINYNTLTTINFAL